ncbi:MAG TPA: hypothetical protein VMB02_09990, partial [Candidatus Aquilonibacter sp.]|nr:hypothetical protein [Candidatus Aquilonibacter sp.]
NFREAITVTQEARAEGGGVPVMEVRIDSRQVPAGGMRDCLERAIELRGKAAQSGRLYLEEFKPFRSSIAWQFNRLYWQRLKDWEQATGKGYETALPGGASDGHHPQAIADSVDEFWKLLNDLDNKGHLPAEVFLLEIGVGTGTRAGLWLHRFFEVDREHGTNYYPRLRFLLGDYSLATLERCRPPVEHHIDLCSFIALDALDPIKTLSFLRHKILHVHSTNMYDNLPDEELVWRDNRIYWVHVRAYLPAAEALGIAAAAEIPASELTKVIGRLLDIGPECLADRSRGVALWQDAWKAMRLEERLVGMEELPDISFPAGLSLPQMEDILREAPNDLRFHLSPGALDSFRNTLPLLHPRGYLEVQDIFVNDLAEYNMGFHGPGKLDGSIVNWVNGALLREVAERAGYNLHFAPFRYRAGSKTSVLHTTRRE